MLQQLHLWWSLQRRQSQLQLGVRGVGVGAESPPGHPPPPEVLYHPEHDLPTERDVSERAPSTSTSPTGVVVEPIIQASTVNLQLLSQTSPTQVTVVVELVLMWIILARLVSILVTVFRVYHAMVFCEIILMQLCGSLLLLYLDYICYFWLIFMLLMLAVMWRWQRTAKPQWRPV